MATAVIFENWLVDRLGSGCCCWPIWASVPRGIILGLCTTYKYVLPNPPAQMARSGSAGPHWRPRVVGPFAARPNTLRPRNALRAEQTMIFSRALLRGSDTGSAQMGLAIQLTCRRQERRSNRREAQELRPHSGRSNSASKKTHIDGQLFWVSRPNGEDQEDERSPFSVAVLSFLGVSRVDCQSTPTWCRACRTLVKTWPRRGPWEAQPPRAQRPPPKKASGTSSGTSVLL